MELKCIIRFITPCHIGYGTGNQLKDFRNKPFIPSQVIGTQIYQEALRFAIPLNRSIDIPKVSDGLTPQEPRFMRLKGDEFFKNDIHFILSINDKDLDIYLAALKSIQNTGIGANTSNGFGYNHLIIADMKGDIPEKIKENFSGLFKEEEFYNPTIVKLIQSVVNRLKRNWISWGRAYQNLGVFERRLTYRINPQAKKPRTKFRGELRAKLIELTGVKHKNNMLICSPNEKICKVCKMMGYLGGKSRLIVRNLLSCHGGYLTYIIGENLSEEEEELIKKALEGYDYKLVLEETLKDYTV